MPELAIAPLARTDLKEIGRYTQFAWGIAQRNAYLAEFAGTFEKLKSGNIEGRSRNEIRKNLLYCPCKKHMIFFRRDDQGNVDILRILHGRMDFQRHL